MGVNAGVVLRALIGSILITALHYTDNYLFIDDYPQPEWIKAETIYVVWVLLTLIGIAGYLLYRAGRPNLGAAYLLLYSYTGLSSLGHYFFGSFDSFSLKMHALVWADGIAGGVVAVCALSILWDRRPQSVKA